MTLKNRTKKQHKYDLAARQIACMAEVAHQVHPRIVRESRRPPKEAVALIINIRAIREWLNALEQREPGSREAA
jgi:hypothetical protein